MKNICLIVYYLCPTISKQWSTSILGKCSSFIWGWSIQCKVEMCFEECPPCIASLLCYYARFFVIEEGEHLCWRLYKNMSWSSTFQIQTRRRNKDELLLFTEWNIHLQRYQTIGTVHRSLIQITVYFATHLILMAISVIYAKYRTN